MAPLCGRRTVFLGELLAYSAPGAWAYPVRVASRPVERVGPLGRASVFSDLEGPSDWLDYVGGGTPVLVGVFQTGSEHY